MQTDKPKLKRCAIYTRKSSEEGLEQEFNSLHAQREACEAYIKSQAGEGWRVIPTEYDDGGISGGTMERAGLKALLSDIEAGLVDIVVVYKVDRLTRSLSDFAKIIDVFDRQGASFVAVTQQFNTTSSMGRLTLNILLSFAQFEREVTGERIRDKLAASKRKGMWMGGFTPLGYDARDRSLVINEKEAQQVRYIFKRYNELNNVSDLKRDIDAKGIFSKTRTLASGRQTGNLPIAKGNLYAMLRNPVYVGEIRHKEICHPGLHEPIISRELWDATQARLDNNRQGNKQRPTHSNDSPLLDKLFDEAGERLIPTQAQKQGRKYRYYISHFLIDRSPNETRRGWRLPAPMLEQTVQESLYRLLHDPMQLSSPLRQAGLSVTQTSELTKAIRNRSVRENDPFAILGRIDLLDGGIKLSLDFTSIILGTATVTYFIPITIQRRGIEMRLVLQHGAAAKADQTMIKAVAKAQRWFEDLIIGAITTTDIARRESVTPSYVARIIKLAFLSPDIVKSIIDGRQPAVLTAEALINKIEIPMGWAKQKSQLGI